MSRLVRLLSLFVMMMSLLPNGIAAAESAASHPAAPQPARYVAMTPTRILDTRIGLGTAGSTAPIGPASSIDVSVTGTASVPMTGVSSVVLNVTAVSPTTLGYLTIFPTGVTPPTASSLNFIRGQVVANLVQVGVGLLGSVTIRNSAGNTAVVADLQGYFVEGSNGSEGLYQPLDPARLLDTRDGTGQPSAGQVPRASSIDLQVTGRAGVPSSGVAAVVLNLTVHRPTANGFLTVFPSDVSRPFASNLNFTPGLTRPNRVIVPVSSDGRVSIYNSEGTTHLIADVSGWFRDQGGPAGPGSMVGVTPLRISDTRWVGGTPLGQGEVRLLTVAGVAGVPAMSASTPPRAVILNVTITGGTGQGVATIFPSGIARPVASDLNWMPGQNIPNLVIARLGPDGAIQIHNGVGTSHVVVDLIGWFS